MDNYELIFTLAAGLALCLFGYRIKKIAFFIIWFLLGYALMGLVLPTINQWTPVIQDNSIYQTLLPIGGGVILSLIGFTIEKFCVAGISFTLVMIITAKQFGTTPEVLAIGALIGVILGALAIRLMKPATIIATAIAGAYAIADAGLNLLPNFSRSTFFLPALAIIALLAALFQFSTTKKDF